MKIGAWARFLADIRMARTSGTLKLFVNKLLYVAGSLVKRLAGGKRTPKHWSSWPFALRGMIKWSQVRRAWYEVSDVGGVLALQADRVEPEDWVSSALQQSAVFLDVGAHQGRYTLQASALVGERGLVIAVEPHPENLRILSRNLLLNQVFNVLVLPGAAWSEDSTVSLDDPSTSDLSKIGKVGFVVEARSIDSVSLGLGLERLDLIKIDVEGSEVEVLKGMTSTLNRLKPKLFIEVHFCEQEVEAFLKRNLYRVDRRKLDPQTPGICWILGVPVSA